MTVKKAVLPSGSLPAVNKYNQYAYRYRIVSEDRNRTSSWSPIKIIYAPTVTFFEEADNAAETVISGNSITTTWSDENNRPRYDVFVRFYFEINKASLTNNTATIHTTINHNLVKDDVIIVAGINSIFNGKYTITNVTADTISYAKTNANIPQFNINPHGSAGLDYIYHGTTPIHTYSFIKKLGTKLGIAIQVEGITIDGTKPFYGTTPGTDVDAGENALLVYTTPSNGIIL